MPIDHAVVDGSNLATEGRSEPSLAQLDEAVAAFERDHEFTHVTVVVDASFEHRVAKKEQAAVKKAIDEGRIVTPPAGVVGRGDTFILQIADRAGAVVVSNDSFQEFHGRFDWLLDEGRIIGGKPVEHVGWIFVPRVPVRGPTSRKAVRKAAEDGPSASKRTRSRAKKTSSKGAAPDGAESKDTAADEADTESSKSKSSGAGSSKSDSTPAKSTKSKSSPAKSSPAKSTKSKSTKSKRTKSKSNGSGSAEATDEGAGGAPAKPGAGTAARAKPPRSASRTGGANPVRAWQRFRRDHPVGTTVEATVERFSSHGAYAVTDQGLTAYLPLRLLADPAPKRARDVVSVGEPHSFLVHEYHEDRRGIDLGLLPVEDGSATPAPPGRRAAKRSPRATKKSSRATKKRGAPRKP